MNNLNKRNTAIFTVIAVFLISFLTSCAAKTTVKRATSLTTVNPTSVKAVINIDKYVSQVSDTAPFMVAGLDGGEKVDYVVSSYPVIFSAMTNENKKTNLSIYKSVSEEFSKMYSSNGFPQAGLFIRKDLLSESNEESIKSFLKAFDDALTDLIGGAQNAISYMNAYGDLNAQKTRFGFASPVLNGCQKDNKNYLTFINEDPSKEEISSLSSILGINMDLSLFSSLYGVKSDVEAASSSAFTVICPQGAPSAALAKFASDTTNIDFAQPAQVSAAFAKGESDFIVFDSVNGMKLSKLNNGNYLLVRMVTYGNLYIVSTGNDEDGIMDDSDYIVSYGEGLVPDLAFKAVFGE